MGLLLLVRHGQASFGADDYDVLSEHGWEQGRRLGAWLREQDVVPDVVVRGGLRRHRDTALAVLEGAGWDGVPPEAVRVDAGWDELDHLALMRDMTPLPPGHTRQEFQAAFEQVTSAWAAGQGDHEETYAGFVERVRGALDRAVAEAGPGRTVLVVSSGGAITAACVTLLDPDPDADLAIHARTWPRLNTVTVNSAVTRVLVGASGPRLLTFNEHSHLTLDSLTYR